jgi:hypothetical protein
MARTVGLVDVDVIDGELGKEARTTAGMEIEVRS